MVQIHLGPRPLGPIDLYSVERRHAEDRQDRGPRSDRNLIDWGFRVRHTPAERRKTPNLALLRVPRESSFDSSVLNKS
jgi:hypothetical protein